MPVPKPSESDLVPKYMPAEAYTFGRAYTKIYDAALTECKNDESSAHARAITDLTKELGISEPEAIERWTEWVYGSFEYFNDMLSKKKN